jgi:hypothetical protein
MGIDRASLKIEKSQRNSAEIQRRTRHRKPSSPVKKSPLLRKPMMKQCLWRKKFNFQICDFLTDMTNWEPLFISLSEHRLGSKD